jgi:hypothetical protein
LSKTEQNKMKEDTDPTDSIHSTLSYSITTILSEFNC